MTPTQAVDLVEFVTACCPQQKVNELTPDAWHVLLGDLDYEDAMKAAASIARVRPFVAPSDIRAVIDGAKTAALPHSSACRAKSCRECVWSWCNCTCHRRDLGSGDGPAAIES